MKKQNPLSLLILIVLTFGIYGIVWLARTRGEMVRKGADIPTTFLIIVPIANYYYLWKWSKGVEHVTNGKMQWAIAFLLQWLLSGIGSAIIQDSFNKVSDAGMPAMGAPLASAMPAPGMTAATQPVATAGPAPSQPDQTTPPQTPPTQLVQ